MNEIIENLNIFRTKFDKYIDNIIDNESNSEVLQNRLRKIDKYYELLESNLNDISIIINSNKINEIDKLFKPFEYYQEFNEDLTEDEYIDIKNYTIKHTINTDIKHIIIDDYLNVNWYDDWNDGQSNQIKSFCKNCKLCINCKNCNDCENCKYCEYCNECIDCKYCEKCKKCENCKKCIDCYNYSYLTNEHDIY
jgi:hypothetical protein